MCSQDICIGMLLMWTGSTTSGQVGPKFGGTGPVADPRRPHSILRTSPKIEWRKTIMTTINLREFYPTYTHDEFVEVTDEVVAELIADKRYEQAHARRMRRNKATYSLDEENGTDEEVYTVCNMLSPETVLDLMERHCRLCRSLNSLPEIQGRRIEAHYILGISIQDIAKSEGVGERNIRKSITRGLEAMKKYFNKF